MPLNYDIFGGLSRPPDPPSGGRRPYQSMQSIHGIKEGNDTCGTCKHLMRERYHGRTYFKCELWHVSNSAATDIRKKNRACNKYEEERDE